MCSLNVTCAFISQKHELSLDRGNISFELNRIIFSRNVSHCCVDDGACILVFCNFQRMCGILVYMTLSRTQSSFTYIRCVQCNVFQRFVETPKRFRPAAEWSIGDIKILLYSSQNGFKSQRQEKEERGRSGGSYGTTFGISEKVILWNYSQLHEL